MSQFDFATINPATTSGTALAALLGSWRDALNSAHRGTTAPPYAVEGMSWLNTVASPYVMSHYINGQWRAIFDIHPTTRVLRAYHKGSPMGDLALLNKVDTSQIENGAITNDLMADGTLMIVKLAPGTPGKVIGFDPTTGEAVEVDGGGALQFALFTTVGANTWTAPANLKGKVKVTVQGGGGGGSGKSSSTTVNGATGGTSSFGSFCSAAGGTPSGSGGAATGGDLNIPGGPADPLVGNGTSPKGGDSMFGRGGPSRTGTSSGIVGAAGTGYGAGGSGGTYTSATPAAPSGGAGGTAIEWIDAATLIAAGAISITVGAGGARGNGSTSDGGVGSQGFVLLEFVS